jgi:DNA invertase Pin-like site-specific DNA recombinase
MMANRHTGTAVPTSQEIRRVALYARVSTLNGQNPEMQLAELREYAQRRDWTIAAEYVDLGVSGARESRPEFNRMMADAHGRTFDAIACWKLDRMGRSLKHLVNTLADLQAYGVAFISLRDNLDLSTPSGRLMFHVVAAMAEFERALIRERVSAGILAARARGKRVGRPRTYANPDRIRELRRQGMPWRQVSKILGIGVGTAVRAMEKPTLLASPYTSP